MGDITKLRDVADHLTNTGKYEKAYYIYDEIYNQIWAAIGTVNNGMNDFSRSYLIHNFRSTIEFKNIFLYNAVNTVFIKWFDLDTEQTLNEFIFTIYGKLQCITYSKLLVGEYTPFSVYSDFLLLYGIILHAPDQKWLSFVFDYMSPIVDDNKVKKIRTNFPEPKVIKHLIDYASAIKGSDWYFLNLLMLDYMNEIGEISSPLYNGVKTVVGRYYYGQNKRKSSSYESKYERYEREEKYEYKYERTENKKQRINSEEFDPANASEEEKARYYGKILGLKGKITKAEIREQYLRAIAKYHPDKVNKMGEEIIELAERKTKEINAAYAWLKEKYNL